ncbi:translation initiation factor IF-2, partial [Mycolicibacterium smegmatis]|nr:translation initiation factor IF-2 [Mycolicibacterium smegmatis]
NKIDKPTSNPDRVMQELTEYGLIPEDWGGETIFVPLSALSGDGIDDLLEMIGLVAEVQELKANPKNRAVGTVIEAELDKSRGPSASLLVQNGTLNVGDAIVVGNTYGRIRAMVNDLGQRIKTAGPS